jgi:hypothetical protein
LHIYHSPNSDVAAPGTVDSDCMSSKDMDDTVGGDPDDVVVVGGPFALDGNLRA